MDRRDIGVRGRLTRSGTPEGESSTGTAAELVASRLLLCVHRQEGAIPMICLQGIE